MFSSSQGKDISNNNMQIYKKMQVLYYLGYILNVILLSFFSGYKKSIILKFQIFLINNFIYLKYYWLNIYN